MTDIITIQEFGFDPDTVENVLRWGTVRKIEPEESEVGAMIGDLYIQTDWYLSREGPADMAGYGRYIGVSQGTLHPTSRFYYYRSLTNLRNLIKDKKRRNPIQPLLDVDNRPRFKPNAVVVKLLEEGPFTMNDLCVGFSDDDKMQFAQLIGYSLAGFGELSYVDNTTYEAALNMYNIGMSEEDARIAVLEDTLDETRRVMKELVPVLFNIAPEDLTY